MHSVHSFSLAHPYTECNFFVYIFKNGFFKDHSSSLFRCLAFVYKDECVSGVYIYVHVFRTGDGCCCAPIQLHTIAKVHVKIGNGLQFTA